MPACLPADFVLTDHSCKGQQNLLVQLHTVWLPALIVPRYFTSAPKLVNDMRETPKGSLCFSLV